MIDLHCHLLLYGNNSQGFLHPRFEQGIQVRTYLKQLGIISLWEWIAGIQKRPQQINEQYQKTLLEQTTNSSLTHHILLAMDGYYDQGYLDKEKTMWYVSNDFIFDFVKQSKKFLSGGSVNPLRRDWENELKKCLEEKVALIKWLPCMMGFDPADKRITKFYEVLATERVPLLTHVGFEFAVPTAYNEYSHLDHLTLPLEIGVTIIAAHCCGGRPFIDNKSDFNHLMKTIEKYPHLYLDVAGMCSVHRKSRLKNALCNEATKERIAYGSDFPIPLHEWAFLGGGDLQKKEKNYFAKDIVMKMSVGMNRENLFRGYRLINPKTTL